MKLWIGGEIQSDVADSFREARKVVEKNINSIISEKDYDIAIEDFDCIAILRDDSDFEEITTYSKKKKDMDFRLRLDHEQFKLGNNLQRESMIFSMIERCLVILKEKGVQGKDFDELHNDIVNIGETNNWSK